MKINGNQVKAELRPYIRILKENRAFIIHIKNDDNCVLLFKIIYFIEFEDEEKTELLRVFI